MTNVPSFPRLKPRKEKKKLDISEKKIYETYGGCVKCLFFIINLEIFSFLVCISDKDKTLKRSNLTISRLEVTT